MGTPVALSLRSKNAPHGKQQQQEEVSAKERWRTSKPPCPDCTWRHCLLAQRGAEQES